MALRLTLTSRRPSCFSVELLNVQLQYVSYKRHVFTVNYITARYFILILGFLKNSRELELDRKIGMLNVSAIP